MHLAFALAVLEMAAAAPPSDALKRQIAEAMHRMEADPIDHAAIEKMSDDASAKKLREMKQEVRALVDAVKTEAEAKFVAATFQGYVQKSPRFRVYDYYILWLGSDVLIDHASDADTLIDALAGKVDRRKEAGLPPDVERELSAFAIELIEAKLGERLGVLRTESEIIKGEAPIDEQRWAKFVAGRKDRKQLKKQR